MIKIENVEVNGWKAAIRGMRNPKNSHDKSDTEYKLILDSKCSEDVEKAKICNNVLVEIGENDTKLMQTLIKAGEDHRKFIRWLDVTLDITAPLYWWKEFKTYRHGRKFLDDGDIFEYDDDVLEYHIETNSCSTMHKITDKEFTVNDFSHEHLSDSSIKTLEKIIEDLNYYRNAYFTDGDFKKNHWWQIIQLLPSSYNQKRTVKLSYEVLYKMYHSRKNHKLDEWVEFCKWIETLPYAKELICI
jgi:hypothetical protein